MSSAAGSALKSVKGFLVTSFDNKYVRIGVSMIIGSSIGIYLVSTIAVNRSKNTIPERTDNDKSNHKQLTIKQKQSNKSIKIGYNDYGDINSQHVLFYLHGYPGSSLELDMLYPSLLKSIKQKDNIRMIGIDRPGNGLSSYYDYTPKTCAYDILSLADSLNINTFIVIGASGGAPFVLSCAAFLPSNRLKCIIPILGMMPLDQVPNPFKGCSPSQKVIFGTPHTVGVWLLYFGLSAMDTDQDLINIDDLSSQYDKNVVMKYPFISKALNASARDAFRNGIAGLLRTHLILKHYDLWGFTIQDLCNNSKIKVHAFYAIQDMNVSITHGEWLKDQTKEYDHISVELCDGFAHLSFVADGGHKYIGNIINQIFDD